MHAMGRTEESMYALHSLPSPTLTNPDMVLPNEAINYTPLPSPPRQRWKNRLPTPNYLKDTPTESTRARSTSSGSTVAMSGTKEKRGLMSRKMMLLRSRTPSSNVKEAQNGIPQTVIDDRVSSDYGSMYGSSPTLMDVGNLAPEQKDQRRSSNGGTSVGDTSVDSDEMRAAREFLAKYEASNPSGTDDELESSLAPQKYDDNSSVISGLEDHRRRQEEEEQNSAILSKRAEEILANAKKRLNLMEGNLRGARDLVTPLTAANLKRATSVGSSYMAPSTTRFVQDGYYHESTGERQQLRSLQTKASSPTMGRDYQGHWRGFSEIEIPDRPYTALDRAGSPIIAQGRIPSKANDPGWSHTLKSVASHDSLGISTLRRPASRDPVFGKGSPDPSLSTLMEDDGHTYPAPPRSTSSRTDSQHGSDFYRPASRTNDLREQMSSLKGKISTLKEKAKEDRLRRQSQQNLREPSPLNNAAVDPPEFFYASSPTYGSPALNAHAGIGSTSSPDNSPTQRMFDPAQVLTGSRNAFAEQAQRQRTPDPGTASNGNTSQSSNSRPQTAHGKIEHKRTPSGTAIVQSSKHRYSHHQYYHVRDMQATYGREGQNQQDGSEKIGVAHGGTSVYDDSYSETDASVYEDAETEQPPVVVAHEDRADAFDYEQFFLHSAIATYGDGRRSSVSSEESVSSVETARGPTAAAAYDGDGDDELDEEDEEFPPGTPQTPEKLRAIERNLHQRTFSDESVSTLASFATAVEGRDTPPFTSSTRGSAMDRPMSPPEKTSRPTSSMSRPKTAIPIKQAQLAASDSSSERADSGVGLNGRSDGAKSAPPRAIAHKSSLSLSSRTTNSTLSPPMSPRMNLSPDPATVAVNTFLQADGRQLGLKDKALLFGLVDSLKKVCTQLQESDGTTNQSQILRRRLEAAKKLLDGEDAI